MEFLPVIGIAVGLAMDAVAVSMAGGAMIRCVRLQHALRMAVLFGGFQGLMPLIGYLAGSGARGYLLTAGAWVAFGLLAGIGIKMMWESRLVKDSNTCDPARWSVIFLLAIATSIDALAAGFSLAMLDWSIWLPVVIIGLVTFGLSLGAVYLGSWIGNRYGSWIEFSGGVILLGIAVKIVWPVVF